MAVRTLPRLFERGVHEHGPRTALRYRREEDWHPITYGQLGSLVEEAALGLLASGVEPGDVVAIVAHSGPQVAVADLAALHAGASVLPLAPSQPPDRTRALLSSAEPAVVVLAPGIEAPWKQPPASVSLLVALEVSPGVGEPAARQEALGAVPRLTMTELYRRGQARAKAGEGIEGRLQAIEPGDVAHLAAAGEGSLRRLSHAAMLREARAIGQIAGLAPGQRCLSLLPLADPLHRTLGHYAAYACGSETWLARSVEHLPADLTGCRPELLLAPPAAFAEAWGDLADRLETSPATQRRLFAWARAVGEEHARARRSVPGPDLGLRARHLLADRLVLGKARAAMGLERLRAAFSSQPPAPEAADGLRAIGVPLRSSYAPEAAGGLVALQRPEEPRQAGAGEPLPGVEVRIDGDDEGEILVRGPSVGTRVGAGGDAGGWLRTGETGRLEEGILYCDADRERV